MRVAILSDVHANADCNANSYAHPDTAGYAYSKTSPNSEGSTYAGSSPVETGTG